ncbi:MAG: DUF262 domain-containing protein [Planctomycetaceae bacterium]
MAKRRAKPNADLPNATEPRDENIEGLGDPDDSGLGDYPIDTLLIRKETRTIFDVVRRINANGFVLNPDFQRDFVWPPEKQSKLIESVVMRIPLPVFYLAEDKQGRTIVVDGLQRLSTFRNFLANGFRLKLPHQETLDKKTFEELSPKLKNRIEDCNLELYLIDSKVPERAKLDIFERVNSGETLTRQQMRNCLYMGPATKWLKDEAGTPLFAQATGDSLNVQKMRDREFVNRFCAFHLIGYKNYPSSDMDDFLAQTLDRMNAMTAEDLNAMASAFHLTLTNNLALFGRHAFRKHRPLQDNRSVVNASLWDVMSTGFARYPTAVVREKTGEFLELFYMLLDNETFNDAITYSPNSTSKVRTRFELANALFAEVFDD